MLPYGNIDVSFDECSTQLADCGSTSGPRLVIRDDWHLTLLGGDVGPMVRRVLLFLHVTGPTARPSSIQIIACRQHIKNRLALLQQDFSTTTSAFIGNYTCRLFALLTDKLHDGPNFGTAHTASASTGRSGCVCTVRGVNVPLSAS